MGVTGGGGVVRLIVWETGSKTKSDKTGSLGDGGVLALEVAK